MLCECFYRVSHAQELIHTHVRTHTHTHTHTQTWVGPVLLAVNSFEAPSPTTHAVLKRLVENVLSELSSKPRALLFNGLSGAGKTFTADQVLLKMFQTAHKSDWLQNLRKVHSVFTCVCTCLRVCVCVCITVLASIFCGTQSTRICSHCWK